MGSRSKLWALGLGIALIALIGEFDLITGPEISLSLLYLLPVMFVTCRVSKAAGFALSMLSAAVWLGADLGAGHLYSTPAIGYWNAIIRLGFFLIVTAVLSELTTLFEWVRTDYLTGLANARGFHELAAKEIERSGRIGRGFSLAYLDIDNFKMVNDNLGHNAGDAVLRLFGDTLQKSTRKSDIVARIGGDEFTILLAGAGKNSASIAMNEIEGALRADLVRQNCSVTFTVGLATFDQVPESVEAAIEKADCLMYEAKRMGKNTMRHSLIGPQTEGGNA